MKDAPSPPPAPDYTGAATAQGVANVESARTGSKLSNPAMVTPYGYSQVLRGYNLGSDGVPFETTDPDATTVVQRLNPESQQIFDQQQQVRLGLSGLGNAALSTARDTLGSGFDTSRLPDAPIQPGTTAQQAIMSRLEPQLQRRRDALRTQLLNEGHVAGNAGYDRAMEDLGRTENDLLLQAGAAGIPMDQQARQQAMTEQAYLRNLPINEIAALMSGSQIQNPQFQQFSGANAGAAPIMQGMQGQAGWNQGLYNSQVGQANAANQGLFSLGAAALMGPWGAPIGAAIGRGLS